MPSLLVLSGVVAVYGRTTTLYGSVYEYFV